MADYPNPTTTPMFLHTFSRYSGLWEVAQGQSRGVPASLTWASANLARYVPISIPFAYPVNRVFWGNGSVVGTAADFGIYTQDGTRLYSTGSTTASGASIPQYTTPATPFVLPPGDYYFALNNAGTLNRGWGFSAASPNLRFGGVKTQAVGATALPANATFATPSSSGMFLFGVTWTTTGF